MKIPVFAAVGLTMLAGLAPLAPAAAQERVVVRERTVTPVTNTRTRVVVRERRGRRAYAYGHRRHRVCTVRYRHGNRIRTCRYVWGRW